MCKHVIIVISRLVFSTQSVVIYSFAPPLPPLSPLALPFFFPGRLPSFADVTPGGEQRKQETNSTVSNRHLCKLKVERGNGLNAGASKANKRTL